MLIKQLLPHFENAYSSRKNTQTVNKPIGIRLLVHLPNRNKGRRLVLFLGWSIASYKPVRIMKPKGLTAPVQLLSLLITKLECPNLGENTSTFDDPAIKHSFPIHFRPSRLAVGHLPFLSRSLCLHAMSTSTVV
jgi:hypothetical protein